MIEQAPQVEWFPADEQPLVPRPETRWFGFGGKLWWVWQILNGRV